MTSFEDKISLMIPAYLRGELSESERQEVENLAAKNPAVAEDIEFQRNLKSGLQNKSDGFEPGDLGWARLSKAIENSEHVSRPTKTKPAIWQAATAVLAVAAVGQAGVIGTMVASNDAATPQYATVTEVPKKLNVVKIGFIPQVTEIQLRESLHEADATIVAGPSSLGLYEIQFKSTKSCAGGVAKLKLNVGVVETVSSCE